MKKAVFSRIYWILAVLALLPLFRLGLWNRHDWGDDFAQYLLQARNIVEGRPQVDNGLVFPEGEQKYAVTAYPVGFPLLLAPVYATFGTAVRPYLVLLTIFFFSTGLLLFHFFKRKMAPIHALLLVLWFCYNPFVIEWKWQILSDLPFLLLTYTVLVFYPTASTGWKRILLWGVFCGFIASVRIVGWALPIAVALRYMLTPEDINGEASLFERMKKAMLLLSSAAAFFLVLNKLIFGVPVAEFAGFYSGALQRHEPALFINLEFYKQLAAFCFPLPFGWGALPWWWILIAIAYWLFLLIRRRALPELFFLVYGIVLLFYPYQNGGLRFLIPLIPLLIFYLSGAIMMLLNVPDKRFSSAIVMVLILVCVAGNKDFALQIFNRTDEVIQGPQDDASQSMLRYVRDSLPTDATIVFCKPRALSFYGNQKTASFLKDASPETSERQLTTMKANYLLVAKVNTDNEIYNPKLDEYLNVYASNYTTVWESNDYRILKRK